MPPPLGFEFESDLHPTTPPNSPRPMFAVLAISTESRGQVQAAEHIEMEQEGPKHTSLPSTKPCVADQPVVDHLNKDQVLLSQQLLGFTPIPPSSPPLKTRPQNDCLHQAFSLQHTSLLGLPSGFDTDSSVSPSALAVNSAVPHSSTHNLDNGTCALNSTSSSGGSRKHTLPSPDFVFSRPQCSPDLIPRQPNSDSSTRRPRKMFHKCFSLASERVVSSKLLHPVDQTYHRLQFLQFDRNLRCDKCGGGSDFGWFYRCSHETNDRLFDSITQGNKVLPYTHLTPDADDPIC